MAFLVTVPLRLGGRAIARGVGKRVAGAGGKKVRGIGRGGGGGKALKSFRASVRSKSQKFSSLRSRGVNRFRSVRSRGMNRFRSVRTKFKKRKGGRGKSRSRSKSKSKSKSRSRSRSRSKGKKGKGRKEKGEKEKKKKRKSDRDFDDDNDRERWREEGGGGGSLSNRLRRVNFSQTGRRLFSNRQRYNRRKKSILRNSSLSQKQQRFQLKRLKRRYRNRQRRVIRENVQNKRRIRRYYGSSSVPDIGGVGNIPRPVGGYVTPKSIRGSSGVQIHARLEQSYHEETDEERRELIATKLLSSLDTLHAIEEHIGCIRLPLPTEEKLSADAIVLRESLSTEMVFHQSGLVELSVENRKRRYFVIPEQEMRRLFATVQAMWKFETIPIFHKLFIQDSPDIPVGYLRMHNLILPIEQEVKVDDDEKERMPNIVILLLKNIQRVVKQYQNLTFATEIEKSQIISSSSSPLPPSSSS